MRSIPVHLANAQTNFLAHAAQGKKLSNLTLRAYRSDLNCFLNFLQNANLNSIERQSLHQYRVFLNTKKGLKPASVKRRLATIRCFLNWAIDSGDIDTADIRSKDFTVKLPANLPKALQLKEIATLLSQPLRSMGCVKRPQIAEFINNQPCSRRNFRHLTTLVALELLYSTGVRVSELCRIEDSDIDHLSNAIHIKGKGDRERKVYIPCRSVSEAILTYTRAREAFCRTGKSLIVRSNGSPADTQYIRKLVSDCAKAAGIERHVTPHMLRHSTATHLVGEGVDIRFVQRLLGHQSITTTQIYTQVSDRALRGQIEAKHPIGGILAME